MYALKKSEQEENEMKRIKTVGGIALFFASLWGGAWFQPFENALQWWSLPLLITVICGCVAGFFLCVIGAVNGE
jgi:hypothetical protein